MTNAELILLASLAAAALLAALAILGVRLAALLRELHDAEPEGATLDSPPLAPADPDEPAEPTTPVDLVEPATPRAGRHHHDTVEIVPAGWRPPIGRHRIAAQLDDTQRIDIDDIEEQP